MNGIIKYSLILILFSFASIGYGQDYIAGKVVKVITTNSLLLERTDNGQSISVQINDSKSLSEKDDKYKQAIEYLNNKVLNQKIYYLEEKVKEDIFYVSIIYDCTENDGKVIKDVPCLNASFLDMELMKQGFITYTGNNEFLKKMAK